MNRFAVAFVAVVFPIAAFADLSPAAPVTVPAGQSLNLETGAVAASGGDLLWNGTTITPQGSAKALNVGSLGISGASGYATLNQAILQAGLQAGLGSSAPISGLAVNAVIGAQDNSGNVAKLLVTAV